MDTILPVGNAPEPVALPHFPSTLHAVIWRNWTLVPLARLAQVLGTSPAKLGSGGRPWASPIRRA